MVISMRGQTVSYFPCPQAQHNTWDRVARGKNICWINEWTNEWINKRHHQIKIFSCFCYRDQPWSKAVIFSLEMFCTTSLHMKWRNGEGMCYWCILTSWTTSCYTRSKVFMAIISQTYTALLKGWIQGLLKKNIKYSSSHFSPSVSPSLNLAILPTKRIWKRR